MTATAVKKTQPKLTPKECAAIYAEACEAGKVASLYTKPPKFLVGTAVGLSDEIDFKQPTYIMEGLCGFAWVNISPARGPFVTYLKKIGVGHKGYYGGYEVSMRSGGQSIDKKEAEARAFVDVLAKYGIEASVQSRLD